MKSTYIKAVKTGNPSLLYEMSGDIDAVYPVIIALDRRNKERSIK